MQSFEITQAGLALSESLLQQKIKQKFRFI